jgi:chromosome segregation ATPase
MRKWTTSLFALGLGLFVAGTALPAAAQNQPQDNQNNNNNNNGGRRNRGNFDPAQMRAQFMERIKEQLGAKDDEWSAIEPRLQKVMDVQRETRGSRGGFGRRGGQDNNQRQSDRPESDVSKAQAELRTALENKDTPPAELAAKLKALRDARDKARGNLAQAQKELKDLLTQRQEAVLVNMGILD